MEGIRILVADDEKRILTMISDYLTPQGLIIDTAADGKEALSKFSSYSYDLIILDIMMPYVDGWSVCREIRKKSKTPVIMLSARGEEYDKLFGFELGVDDYIVKPFSLKELLARIKAVIRRSSLKSDDSPDFKYMGLSVDFASRNVYVDDKKASLTPKEYELLSFFIQNRNIVFSRDQLLNEVWGYEFYGDHRTVDTHIKMLRESLGPYRDLIVTVWGTGYKFESGDTK